MTGLMFLLGFLGSAHCLGMCSGFVVCLAARVRGGPVLYHGGRLMAYTLLGAALGTVGMGARLWWDHTGGRWMLGLAGTIMVLLGMGLLSIRLPGKSSLTRILGGLLARPTRRSALGLGWLSGVLPCGLLYAALARSAAAADAAQGAMLMAAFWLGTLPALLSVSVLAPLLRSHVPSWWPRVAATATIAIGLLTLWHAATPAAPGNVVSHYNQTGQGCNMH